VDPEGKNPLVGFSELARAGQNPAPVDPDGKVEGRSIFERQGFRAKFGSAVKGDGCGGGKGFRNASLFWTVRGMSLSALMPYTRLVDRSVKTAWCRLQYSSIGTVLKRLISSSSRAGACPGVPASTDGFAAASSSQSQAGCASSTEGSLRSAMTMSHPRERREARLVSEPARDRLSIPRIWSPSRSARSLRAMVLPAKPQIPVIRTRIWRWILEGG
jgi:hypothetical protein